MSTPKGRRRVAGPARTIVAVGAALLVACGVDPAPPPATAGLLRTPDGGFQLEYRLCAPAVERLELREATPGEAIDSAPLLWSIEATGPAEPRGVVVVGRVPRGYREVAPLRRSLADVQHLSVVLDGPGRHVGVALRPADASTDRYAVDSDEPLEPGDFHQRLAKACDDS